MLESSHGEQLGKLFQNRPIIEEFTIQTRSHAWTYTKPPMCQLSWTLSVTLTFEPSYFKIPQLMMKLQSIQAVLWIYLTLTFELGTQVFRRTIRLHMRNICDKLFQNPPMNKEFTVQTRCIMNIFDLWPLNVTLIFELGTWVWHLTCRLHMVNICINLFQNPPMNDEFTVRTSCIMPILNLWPQSVTLILIYELGTWVLHTIHRLHMVNICAK